MNLTAIDPGNICGCAIFIGNILVDAFTIKKQELRTAPFNYDIDLLLIEKPVIYPTTSKGDPNDLIDLALLAGSIEGRFKTMSDCTVQYTTPRTWKGTVPKNIHHKRILKKLGPTEIVVLPKRPRAKDYDHNMLDAVGLGLWRLETIRALVGI